MSITKKKIKKEEDWDKIAIKRAREIFREPKQLSVICYDCAIQIYCKKIRMSDRLRGITMWSDKCSICGKKSVIVPLRDYLYAQGEGMWD